MKMNLKKIINNLLLNKPLLPTVAVSGGIDSITLAVFISKMYKEKNINVAHAISPAVPKEATNRVKKLADQFNWNLNIINANEINDPRYIANPINRCFFCKENLYTTIKSITKSCIFSGANIDDLHDYRPGLNAAKDADVKHPFIDAKINKKMIRKLASDLGLGNLSELPSSPCLASRIETGIPVTPNLLSKIDNMERCIKQIIPNADIRCRWLNSSLSIQFNTPKVNTISKSIKKLIIVNAKSIFLIEENKIEFKEYKRGSAFIKKQLAINNEK